MRFWARDCYLSIKDLLVYSGNKVVEDKSIQRYKNILIRIKDDKKEQRLAQLQRLKKEKAASNLSSEVPNRYFI